MGLTKLVIRGARQHNLKNISVEIPRNSLTVITGLSGSGKSSLAFDTIYAEGQRRYVESLSAYARQFLEMMQKPDVDHIEGLSPVVHGRKGEYRKELAELQKKGFLRAKVDGKFYDISATPALDKKLKHDIE